MRICDRCGRKIEDDCNIDEDIFVNLILTIVIGKKDLCCRCKKELLNMIKNDILELREKIKEFIKKN